MNIYVVVPCFNEIRTIKKIIESLVKIKLKIKIILVDDGSNDGTKQLILWYLVLRLGRVGHCQANLNEKIY